MAFYFLPLKKVTWTEICIMIHKKKEKLQGDINYHWEKGARVVDSMAQKQRFHFPNTFISPLIKLGS